MAGRSPLFTVDLHRWKVDELVDQKDELVRIVRERTERERSELGAQKQAPLTRADDPPLQRLRETFVERCAEILEARGSVWTELQAVRAHSVLMDQESTAIEEPHCHPGFTLSGIYYVAVPEEVGRHGQAGCLDFVSPLPPSRGSYPDVITLIPEEGHLYVFDSWLYHRPHPIESGLRISISLDALFL